MSKTTKIILVAAIVISGAVLITWQATGGDYYTKYQVVEKVEAEIDPNDPLAQAGFYDEGSVTQTVTRDEFRLGLLPTPSGLIDKHAISVVSILLPIWVIIIIAFWLSRMRRRRTQPS
ncbi:MAG: hypothetical protein GWO41_07860 [candidate division Zixibacteria bacterium]|nr:hypothetical protein [candidate division Zixibacteria bacterium]NIR63088.1 hypothetical protein [candidate division Zixibacteria bacterium]NIS16564.1 hypothetical protein [candidate division Zixibacteria bacterium]NIS45085.1 hypothetical protein [candidate division Zixibacteria bacterium]NIT52640.1 hypothetical protein [candidate division Zixibacteria bacterium]